MSWRDVLPPFPEKRAQPVPRAAASPWPAKPVRLPAPKKPEEARDVA